MRFRDCFKSKYLSSDDFADGEEKIVTISQVEKAEFEDGVKPAAAFTEIQEQLPLNRINFHTIEELHGYDTESWTGKRIQLYVTEVDFKGRQTRGIRVRSRIPELAVGDDVF